MLRIHIGNSAALNSSTIVLAFFSVWVSSLKGISGAFAMRASITPNATSIRIPSTIGPSASNVLQPFRPASTTPNTSTIWPSVRVTAPARSNGTSPRVPRRSVTTA